MRGYPEHLHEVINEDMQENIYDETLDNMTEEDFIRVQEVKAFEFNGELFKTRDKAENAANHKRLEYLVEKMYYRGIDENGLVEEILSKKNELLTILQKLI